MAANIRVLPEPFTDLSKALEEVSNKTVETGVCIGEYLKQDGNKQYRQPMVGIDTARFPQIRDWSQIMHKHLDALYEYYTMKGIIVIRAYVNSNSTSSRVSKIIEVLQHFV